MTRPSLTIVEAAPAHVLAFAGAPPPFTFKGHAALIGTEVVGLGGVYYRDGLPVIFADYREDLGKRVRVQGFRFIENELAKLTGRLFAICDQTKPTAPGLLARLGFRPLADGIWWARLNAETKG